MVTSPHGEASEFEAACDLAAQHLINGMLRTQDGRAGVYCLVLRATIDPQMPPFYTVEWYHRDLDDPVIGRPGPGSG